MINHTRILLFIFSSCFFGNGLFAQDCAETDRAALIELYNATDGENWTNKTNWLTDAPIDEWYGIGTNIDGCVISIRLDNNNLNGLIPDLNLPNLQDFYCQYNKLSGAIPDFSNLPNLTAFLCKGNNLTGIIPNFSNLPLLESFFCTANNLSGTIPNFSNLPNLQRFWCVSNNLSGTIPDFSNLPNLAYFGCGGNDLSGEIPNFSNLPKLQDFTCDNNDLSGEIPNFSNLPNLQRFWCVSNNLSGTIPDFSNLPNLVKFGCGGNDLSDEIPNFSNLPSLQEFNCRQNNLSGAIPNFSNLPKLANFYAQQNSLSGTIPSFTNLTSLKQLALSDNNLSGCISEDLKWLCTLGEQTYNPLNNFIADGFNFTNNPGLPWRGDGIAWCNNLTQIGASCDDGNPSTTNDQINENCECQGILCEVPIADAGLEEIITCTDTIVRIGGPNSSDGAGFAYAWTTINGLIKSGASTPNARVSQAGTYFLEVRTVIGGCSSIDSVVVMADNIPPTINLVAPPSLNCEVIQVSIDATNSSEGTYQWETEDGQIIDGETTLNPTVNQSGNYFLTIIRTNGCTSTKGIQISIDTVPPVANINPTEMLTCTRTTLTLDATNSEAVASYQWRSSNGNPITNPTSSTPTISESDTYILEVTATNGCKHTETITIIEDTTLPNVAIDSVPILNCTNPTFQLSAINPERVEQYQWATVDGNITTAANTSMLTIDQAGTYELMVTAANGCLNTTSVVIDSDFEAPIANAGLANQIIPCNTSLLILDGNTSENATTYHWQSDNGQFNTDNLTQANIEIGAAGDYTLVITASNGCKDSTTVFVNEASRPRHIHIEMEGISCHNETDGQIRLLEIEGGTAPFSYAILADSFQTSNEFNSLSSNTYYPMVKDANNCLLEMEAMELENPQALSITVNQEESLGVCTGKKTSLIAQVSGAIGRPFFDWTGDNIEHQADDFECSVIQITPFISSSYFIEATDEAGCTIRDTLPVEVLKFGEKSFILTPDGNGQEDELSILCLEEEIEVLDEKYPEREIIIVNRWGSQVYRAKPYNNDWDGRNQDGTMLPFGTYYYLLRLNVGEGEILRGDILLLR